MMATLIGLSSSLFTILIAAFFKRLDKNVFYGLILSGIAFLYVGYTWTTLLDIFHAKAQKPKTQRRKILIFNTLRLCENFASLREIKISSSVYVDRYYRCGYEHPASNILFTACLLRY